jgi:outer membrane receptor protein involved in Fe transport
VFLALDRGNGARNLAAMIDPRSGAPVARLDPAAGLDTIEIGFRRHLPLGIETTVSMFRARSDLELLLTGENAITQFSRPTLRQGVKAVARYEPAKWLAMDFMATAVHARFADGAAEYVPGAAEKSATATATVRMPKGWSAGLAMSYLGKRQGIDDSASLASSTFVNARLARDLSKKTRVSLDLLNLFDQRLREVDYFSASQLSSTTAEPRGVRLKLRTTF